MGAGATLMRAVDDLAALPADSHERMIALPQLHHLRIASPEDLPMKEFDKFMQTTQKLIDGRYSTSHHVGSFVGFFPANHPQLQITVVVNDGRVPTGGPAYGGTAYGGTVAAPSFKRIGEQLIPYLGIRPADATVVRPAIAMTGNLR